MKWGVEVLCENCQINEEELKVKVTSKNKTEEKMVYFNCEKNHINLTVL